MPVSHAATSPVMPGQPVTAGTQTGDGEVPGLLAVLAMVPDPRHRRGRRFNLVFVLAVAAVCVLAGAKSFREIGDQAADLPQQVLAELGGRLHPLRRRIVVPSEKRIRTLIQLIDAAGLDGLIGTWLAQMAQAGKLAGLLKALAIDGKWLRGVEGVKLFAAMLQEERVIIAQHQIPAGTNEITQVEELLEHVDLTDTVVTADAAHAQHDTAAYIAGTRGSDYLLSVKGNQPTLRDGIFEAIQATIDAGDGFPDHVDLDVSHGRLVMRSLWRTGADGIEFPHATQILRIRRDTYDLTGAHLTKEIVHGITSLDTGRGTPQVLATYTRGQWGIESTHWIRDTLYREDDNTAYVGDGPQVMATLRNLVIGLLHLKGITEITRTVQQIGRDRTRALLILPL